MKVEESLTDSMSSGLTAVVKQRHVGQTVSVVHMATAFQNLGDTNTELVASC